MTSAMNVNAYATFVLGVQLEIQRLSLIPLWKTIDMIVDVLLDEESMSEDMLDMSIAETAPFDCSDKSIRDAKT